MSMPKAMARLDLLGLVEGHYASEIALGLIRSGALELLAAEPRIDVVARIVRMDPKLLNQMLDFVTRTTDLIECDRTGRYRLGNYPFAEIAFQFQKFIGAYGQSVRRLSASRSTPPLGSGIGEGALAAAFAAVDSVPSRIAERLRRDGYRRLVDLGCGPASLLIEMARRDEEFIGIGLDQSSAMCRLARSRIREAGVASRVRVERADVRDIGDALNARERRRVEAIHGRSVINAFFGTGLGSACAVLRKLRSAFPGRAAFFVDYYGELGRAPPSKRQFRLGRIQDIAQLASGQGIPPSSRREWRALYRAAGCKLISTDEMRNNDIRWFIHEVRLAL